MEAGTQNKSAITLLELLSRGANMIFLDLSCAVGHPAFALSEIYRATRTGSNRNMRHYLSDPSPSLAEVFVFEPLLTLHQQILETYLLQLFARRSMNSNATVDSHMAKRPRTKTNPCIRNPRKNPISSDWRQQRPLLQPNTQHTEEVGELIVCRHEQHTSSD